MQTTQCLETGHDVCTVGTQERIGCLFDADSRGQGRLPAIQPRLIVAGARVDGGIVRLDFTGEFEVGKGVFVAGENGGVFRKRRQFGQ